MQNTVVSGCAQWQLSCRRRRFSAVALAIAVPLVFAAMMLAVSECLNQGGFGEMLAWIWRCPVEATLNLAIYACLTWFLVLLTNGIDRGCQVAILFMLLPVISVFKRASLLEPLLPSDFGLIGQMTTLIRSYVGPSAVIAMVAGVLCVALMGFAIRLVVRAKFRARFRLAGCAGAAVLLLVAGIVPRASGAVLRSSLSRQTEDADLAQEYRDRGFAVAFVSLAEQRAMAGVAYTEASVHQVAAPLRSATNVSTPAIKPDIVVILSESLWDATQLPGVKFSSDPLPTLHTLQKEGADLRFLSSTFGGGTANPEFEVLTGFSVEFLREGRFPFVDPVLRRGQPSVARYFTSMGYRAVGFHNFTNSFWQRNHVYPRLGFREFNGTEEVFEGLRQSGGYVADAVLGERVMEKLQNADCPMFIMAITMQNHGPYRSDRYDRFDVEVDAPTLSERQQQRLQVYTQGLYETDRMLGNLVESLRQRAKPTILVYFGDHLPSINDGYDVQQAAGLVKGNETAADRLLLHTTPAVVWSNYSVKPQFAERVLSPGLIWPELLHSLGMDHPFYGQFLDRVRRELPGISHGMYVDSSGNPMLSPPESADHILSDFRLIQHDLLEADRFSLDELFSEFEVEGIRRWGDSI